MSITLLQIICVFYKTLIF